MKRIFLRKFLIICFFLYFPFNLSQAAIENKILLDDFEDSSIRIANPGATPDKLLNLWSQFEFDWASGPDPGVAELTSETSKDGSKSIKVTLTGGNLYFHFFPYDSVTWHYLREYVPSWQLDTYNRIRFWIKVPHGVNQFGGGLSNTFFGTYFRSVASNDVYSAESGGGHYYHQYDLTYTGEWHQIIVDTHPHHSRGESGSTEQPNKPYPTGEAGYNYFDLMTRFYVDMNGGLPSYPMSYYLDSFELYKETYDENIEQVYALNGVYVPSSNKIYVGWSRPKDDNYIKHDLRYSFEDIYSVGWANATPAPNGTVAPEGWGGYNSMRWNSSEIDVSGKNRIYIAIKPQNSDRFRQIEIPLKINSTPTSPSPSLVPTPVPQTLVGDLNNDKIVNSLDWSLMNAKWFTADATADLNKDGLVNAVDFSLLNANWFKSV